MSNRDLIKHIEALNLADESDVEIVTKLEHWADYDIYTPEEFDRYMLEQDYLACYKDVYGIRARVAFDSMTDDMLKLAVSELYIQLEAEIEDQREWIDDEIILNTTWDEFDFNTIWDEFEDNDLWDDFTSIGEIEDMEINENWDQLDREWAEAQLAAETELEDGAERWDDIAEMFDDITKVKQIFH